MTRSHKKHIDFRAVFFVLLIAAIALTIYTAKQKETPAEALPSPSGGELAGAVEPPAVAHTPTPGPETPSPSPSEEPSAGPDLAAREAKDDAFFSDAAFMGNSLMDGFRLFSGLTTCDYYAATSMTVIGAESKAVITLDNGQTGTLLDGLSQKPYGKIYILLGINEIGYDVDTFISCYSEMLDRIVEAQPDCDIYIMGLTPVSSAKSQSSDTFNMTRIQEYNAALHQLAADKGCYYMDLVEALAGTDGYLPAAETADGIHLSVNLYKTWLDYVRTHYA